MTCTVVHEPPAVVRRLSVDRMINAAAAADDGLAVGSRRGAAQALSASTSP